MIITVKRIYVCPEYTIGRLSVDGKYFCDTLEDTVRADGVKIFGETAIPAGTYKVIVTMSQRFKRELPLLVDVPMFSGIRIHPGNTAADTHGCLLVGINTGKGIVSQSKITFDKLFALIKEAKDVIITIS